MDKFYLGILLGVILVFGVLILADFSSRKDFCISKDADGAVLFPEHDKITCFKKDTYCERILSGFERCESKTYFKSYNGETKEPIE